MRAGGWRWLAGALLLLLLLPSAPARAQEAVAFRASTATPRFPERIEFRLSAAGLGGDITDVRLYYGHVQSAVRTQVRPSFTPGREIDVSFALNLRERYLPPGSHLEFFWSARDSGGARVESPRQRFMLVDPRHTWRERSLGLLTLHWYAGNDAFADDVLATAQRTLDRLQQQVGVAPTEPINIYLYGSTGEFGAALPPNSAEWIGGQAYPALNLIVAGLRPDGGAAREIRRMIPHEISHIVLHQATRNPYNTPPNWLDEGLAVYNQETADPRFPPLVRDAARDGRLIPLRALNSSFGYQPSEAILSYAQSGAIVEFLLQEYGPAKAAALVAVFREGVSYDEAVQRALGLTLEELDAQWRAAVAGGSAVGTGGVAGTLPPTNDGLPFLDGEIGAVLASLAPLVVLVLVGGAVLLLSRRGGRERWL
jgi:hypothetical protein